jgi:hypothetical protein
MSYIGTQPNNVKKNIGLYNPNEILQLTKEGSWGGSLELIESQIYSSGTISAVDFTAIKGAKYDVHFLTWSNIDFASEEVPALRFFESGVIETASVYQFATQGYGTGGTFTESKSTGETYLQLGNYTDDNTNGYVYIYNANNSSKYTFISSQSMDDDQDSSPQSIGYFGGGVLPQASKVDGIRFTGSASVNFSSYTVKLYGVKQI